MTQTVTVWKGIVGIHERCLIRHNGDYYGIDSRRIYPKGEYRHSPVYLARVVAVDDSNETGMIYRDKRNHADLIGQRVEVEQAHYYGEHIIWRTVRERYYLSSNEIELVYTEPIR